ncbi:hypothetical protein [Streptomyces sp. NPDC059802]|uniref:hypothetical protein n=1 Tax=Streptomyces sp. NPDC059802 TaxID=3346952 RepID=UPI0036495DE7
MKRTRAFTTAAVLVTALLAGTSGCTSAPGGGSGTEDSGGKPPAAATKAGRTGADSALATAAQTCRGGTCTWFDTQRLPVLNGVTEPQHVTTTGTVRSSRPMIRLRTDLASLKTEGPVPGPADVLGALAVHVGLADEGEPDASDWTSRGSTRPSTAVPASSAAPSATMCRTARSS